MTSPAVAKMAGFMGHLPEHEQAEYGAGEGPTVAGVGRLHSGWPRVRGVLVDTTDPYSDPKRKGDK